MTTVKRTLGAVAAGLLATALPVGANSITYTGAGTSTSGQGIAASATFDLTGTTLKITLENTWPGSGGTQDDAAVLVAVLFSGLDGLSATGATAFVPSDDQTWTGAGTVLAGGLNVGGEWRYQSITPTLGATAGISTSGLGGLFSGAPNLNGDNLNATVHIGGADYGIVSADYDASNANNGLKKVVTIKNSVEFTFNYSGTLANLGDVQFAYGTAPDSYVTSTTPHSHVTGAVPDGGATIGLLVFALVGVGFLGRRIVKA